MAAGDWWWWLAIAAAAALLRFSPVGVDLRYRRAAADGHGGPSAAAAAGRRCPAAADGLGAAAVAVWWLWPALRLSWRVALDRRTLAATRAAASRAARAGRLNHAVRTAWRFLGPRLRVRRLEVSAVVGCGDPAATGVLVGVLWAAWGAGFAALRRAAAFRHAATRFHVRPDMLSARLDVDVRCIAAVPALHIISALPRVFRAYVAARGAEKGAAPAWPIIRSRAS